MRLDYKQAWQHLANKKREGESDIDDKFKVIRILHNYFGLYGLTGEILMINSESCRLPDILIKTRPLTVIELDGGVHGQGDPISKRGKDVNRDSDYISKGVRLVIINKQVTDNYETKKVIKILEDSGLKRK